MRSVILIIVAFIIAIVAIVFSFKFNSKNMEKIENIPNSIVFAYGNEYSLKKEGDKIELKYVPGLSAAATERVAPKTIQISISEFQEIWDKIRILDFERYQNLTEKDITPVLAQPGEGMSTSIKIEINGNVLVDRFFAGPDNILSEELAKPLDEINNLIAGMINKN